MKILSGKAPAAAMKNGIKDQISESGDHPYLVIMKVGHDPASDVYVRNKLKACQEVGITCSVWQFDEDISQSDLIEKIHCANQDMSISGIMVQLPLPKHMIEQDVISAISPAKDVDGLHPKNVGLLACGCESSGYIPCTPLGIMFMLFYYGIPLYGKHVVIVGRSNIVGKPLAMLMLAQNATVTICHSKTENLKQICRQADILVTAIGKPKFFTEEYVGNNAVVIDVGINRDENGKLCGDVDADSVKDVVSALSPVPGGVGLMTVASLMFNCTMTQETKWKERFTYLEE